MGDLVHVARLLAQAGSDCRASSGRMSQLKLWHYGAMFSVLPSEVTDVRENIRHQILTQDPGEKNKRLLAFKEARMNTCSMTAVAVSVLCHHMVAASSSYHLR